MEEKIERMLYLDERKKHILHRLKFLIMGLNMSNYEADYLKKMIHQ